jgi:hypothetical protein
VLTVGLAVTLAASALLVGLLLVIRQRQRAAATMNEARIAKETFSHTLGIVCHELRNPVHALKGVLSIGMEDSGKREGLPAVDVAVALDCVNAIQHVLDDVLEMQRTDVVSRVSTRCLFFPENAIASGSSLSLVCFWMALRMFTDSHARSCFPNGLARGDSRCGQSLPQQHEAQCSVFLCDLHKYPKRANHC